MKEKLSDLCSGVCSPNNFKRFQLSQPKGNDAAGLDYINAAPVSNTHLHSQFFSVSGVYLWSQQLPPQRNLNRKDGAPCYSCVSPAFRGLKKKQKGFFHTLEIWTWVWKVSSCLLRAFWFFWGCFWSSKQIRALSGDTSNCNTTLIQFSRMLIASKFPPKAN